MKWLNYLLVLVNLGFFAWQYQKREAALARAAQVEAAEPAYVTRLLLLSELPRGATESGVGPTDSRTAAGPAAATPSPAVAPSPPAPAVSAGVPAASDQAASARPAVSEQLATVAVSDPPAGEEHAPALPAPAGVQARPSRPPAAAPPAPTTAEPPPVASGPGATPAGVAGGAVEPPPTDPRHCYVVGPLAEDAPVDAMRAWLAQQGGRVQSRFDPRQEPKSFWVFIPPAASAAAARETYARLQADGVKDVMRLSTGSMVNGISLGLYNRRGSAEQRVAELKRLGYAAEIEPRFKDVREGWLDVTFEGPKDLPRDAFRGAFPQAKLAAGACR